MNNMIENTSKRYNLVSRPRFFIFFLKLPLYTAILLHFTATKSTSQQFTAQDLVLICSGLSSVVASSEDGTYSYGHGGLRFDGQQGMITVYQGDTEIAQLSGADYSSYSQCVQSLREIDVVNSASPQLIEQGEEIARFTGEIRLTSGNTTEFFQFIEEHIHSVVFIDIKIGAEFASESQNSLFNRCNAGLSGTDFWEYGFADSLFRFPIGTPDESFENLACSELPISFTGKEFEISSAGAGTHWFVLQGFFRITDGPGRWPNLQLVWLDANADMWARVQN